MAITPLPSPPQPTDTTAQFNSKAFAWVAALGTFVTEANATEAAVDADAATASTKASEASASASSAATSASNAATSATAANNAKNAAESARDATLAAFDSFDDRYLGSKTADPTVDNDGNPLVAGALYFNSVSGVMRVYTGSAWVAAYVSPDGLLPLAGGTMTGAITFAAGQTFPGTGDVTTTGTQTLTNKTITSPELTGAIYANGSQRSNIVAVPALDIDCNTGNYFTKTINGNSTFTFSNVPASRAYGFTLELTHTSGTVTWPAAVRWPGDSAPSLTTGRTHLFVFVTDDGGTRWRGAALKDYVN